MEKERFPEFSERIAKRFDELLSVLYLENELWPTVYLNIYFLKLN